MAWDSHAMSERTGPIRRKTLLQDPNPPPTEHPFHLHGLHFEVLAVNGEPPPFKMVEDTYNLRIRDRLRIRVVADNPGDWMFHCHVIEHMKTGLMGYISIS